MASPVVVSGQSTSAAPTAQTASQVPGGGPAPPPTRKRGRPSAEASTHFVIDKKNKKMTCRACLGILSHHSARYKTHLLSCDKFKTKDADAYRRLLSSHASPAASATEGSGGGPSRAHSVAATNAFYMSMSVEHAEAVNLAYAEAVFASGGKFGYCADEEEWGVFWGKLVGGAWRPPSRQTMSTKYVNTVFSKVDAEERGILCTMPGGCFQCDAWTDPSGSQVFSALFGGSIPFYLSSFRMAGSRETADALVAKIKEQMALLAVPAGDTWRDQHNTGIVTDSPNVNLSARRKFLEGGDFTFAYGCASHAMNNLCRDILKIPAALRALAFCTALAKLFGNHHLPHYHLFQQQALEPTPPPTLKLFSPTRWTGSAALLTSTLKNRSAISTVLFKAQQKNITMDFPDSLFAAVLDNSNWDAVSVWEPVLRNIAAITDYLQADTTPLSGVHAAFLCLEASLVPSSVSGSMRAEILGFIKARYATIFSHVHILAFYLDPLFMPYKEVSRASAVKPFEGTDGAACLDATKRLLRAAPAAEQAVITTQVTQTILGNYPFFQTGATSESAKQVPPHAWWDLHAAGAPPELRAVATQVFSLAPTSAAGERSFKQRSRVHNKTRNRLSDDNADKTQAIIFNERQARRYLNGALLKPRDSKAETFIAAVLRRRTPVPLRNAISANVEVPDDEEVFECGGDAEGGAADEEDDGGAFAGEDVVTVGSAEELLARVIEGEEAARA